MATQVETSKMYNGKVTVDFYPVSHMYKITDEENGMSKVRVRGVTTVIGIIDKSTALISWATETAGLHLMDVLDEGRDITMDDVRTAVGKHKTVKDGAASIGTQMHAWCEYFIRHKLGEAGYEAKPTLPEDPQILLGITSFLDWHAAHNVKFMHAERVLYSRTHQYVGTADFIAEVDGKVTLGDFKSSNGLYNTVRLQTQAYAAAYTEETGIKVEQRMAVRLAKETKDEYTLRMQRKNLIKGVADAEIPEYQPFEWLTFGSDTADTDMNAFLAAKQLVEWNAETDFYKNK